MALEKIIVEYRAEISELRKDLDTVKKQLVGVSDQAKASSEKTQKDLNDIGTVVKGKLNDSFMMLGKTIAGVFAIERIGNFINSSIELATRTQEVKAAFDKLNNPALLNNLVSATEGTVSNLNLMGIALKASNLQVPLEKLATILKFAKQRADELGGSTEDLANTIIQGIGVKSTRALVQVGISQEQFGAEVKKTGDYFSALDNIMTTTLENAGDGFDSVADKQAKLRATIENTKASIGSSLLEPLAKVLTVIDQTIKGWQLLTDGMSHTEKESYDLWKKQYEQMDATKISVIDYQKELEKLKKLRDQMEEDMRLGDIAKGEADQLEAIKGQIKALEELNPAQKKTAELAKQWAAMIAYSTQVVNEYDAAQQKSNEELKVQNEELEKSIPLFKALLSVAQDTALPINTIGINTENLADAMLHAAENTEYALKPALQSVSETATQTGDDLDKLIQGIQTWGNAFMKVLDSVNSYYQKTSDYRLEILQNELQQGLITQEYFDNKSKQYKKEQAERDKKFSLFQIAIDTATAIVQALSTGNVAQSVAAAVVGAVQAAVVESTPIPAFAKGVVGFQGKGTETSDDNLVRISKNESIITAKATKKHAPLLKAMNKDKFDDYLINFYLPKLMKAKAGGGTFQSFEDRHIVQAIREETMVTRETNKILKSMKQNSNIRREW